MYTLDSRDRAILDVISDRAELTYTEIAKYTKISKDSVRARIDNLVKEGFIKRFFPFVNYTKLGYHLFHAYLKLGAFIKNEKRFIQSLIDNKFVVSVTRIIGDYDFEINILARGIFDFYQTLGAIVQSARKFIIKAHPVISLEYHKFTMNLEKQKGYLPLSHLSKKHDQLTVTLDALDMKLLKLLSKNAREKYIILAQQLKTTPETIRYRIKKLCQQKVIKNFYTSISKPRAGLGVYILLLNMIDRINKQDVLFIKNEHNLFSAEEVIGDWTAILKFHAKDNNELKKTLDLIRDYFGIRLNSFSLLICLDRYKFAPVPEGVVFQA